MKYKDDFKIAIKKLYKNENIISKISKEEIEAHGARSKSQIEKNKKNNFFSLIAANQNKAVEKYLKYEDGFYYGNYKKKIQ